MPAGSPLTACGDRLQRASRGFLDAPVKPENDKNVSLLIAILIIINSLIIMTTLFYKIPPNLPLTKGGIIPSLEKRGTGRFSD
jgi:hypothetical protein